MQTIKDLLAACPAAVKYLLVLLVAGGLLCWGGYQYGRYAAAGNDANAGGIQQAREQLERAGDAQQRITAGIDGAAQSIGSFAGSVERGAAAVHNADAAVGRVEDQLDRAGELIANCQSILAGVRARAERAAADAGSS